MHWPSILWGSFGFVALGASAAAGWILSLPQPRQTGTLPAIALTEAKATIAALRPPKRQRPLIAIIGINDATETTDYLMPYGILRRADVADVVLLATGAGPVVLYPALKVEPQATVAAFDAQHPGGADYVLVPAMSRDEDPAVLKWIVSQASKGAVIIGICAGAKVVAAAGLLNGKRATTHWYYLAELRKRHPAIRYVADRRFVVDGGVATTTGISASMPLALALIEAIAGHDKAQALGRDLGLMSWDARHDSAAFKFTRPFALTAIGNSLAFWAHEQLGLEVASGIDEVSLALVADAWSRTYMSRVVTFASSNGAEVSRNGIRILPDAVSAPPSERLQPIGGRQPVVALDEALQTIAVRYGRRTADFVAMQLEYTSQGTSDEKYAEKDTPR